MSDESQDILPVDQPDVERELISRIRDEPNDALIEEYARLRLENGAAARLKEIGSDSAAEELADDLVAATGNSEEREQYLANIQAYLRGVELGKRGSTPDPSQRNQQTGADPVQMFNGEFLHEVEDMRIDGAGIDFVFHRTYRNQVVFSGPLGANWDHSYDIHLKASDTELVLTTGELREQRYQRHPLFNYFVPPDGVDAIFEALGESFSRRAPDGTRHIFAPDPSLPTFHRLARIEDRFGNFLDFVYREDEGGLLDQVSVNHPQRVIRFNYDAQGRISEIVDYAGRAWCYAYDDLNDLIAVTTPATDRNRNGLTTRYEYRTAATSNLAQHNLTRVVDAANQLYLENEYGESPGQLTFNRVVRQRQGGGETIFEYEDVAPVFERDYTEAQRPAHQTTMTGRNGHLTHYVYNRFGNLLFEEERIIQGGLPRILSKRYRCNRDGQLTASLSPEGVLTQQLYGREVFIRRNGISDESEVATHGNLTPEERLEFGRLFTTVRRGRTFAFREVSLAQGVWGDLPDIIGGFEPDGRDIIIKFTYEPTYGQLLTASDPRFTLSPDPTIQTTAAGEHPRYEETLTRYVYRGPVESPGVDPTRLLAQIQRPTPTLPDGSLGEQVVERFEAYDARGRLERHLNAVGTETVNTYFDNGDERDGYLKRTIVDPTGLAITTEYEVDKLGRVVAVHLPRAVEAADARFVTRTAYNALDQITEVIASAPFNFKTRRFYDRNGKLEREERDARDETGADIRDAPEVRTFKYDEEFNLVRETAGGADLSAHLVTRHCYDTAGQRALTLLPEGNQINYRYDERLLAVAQTMGAGSGDAATVRTEYDGDGRVQRTFDARGNAVSFTLNTFGRVTVEEDALGHLTLSNYDKAGNGTCTRQFERRADGYYLLARSEKNYDELNRAIRSGVNRFDDPLGPFQREELDTTFLAAPGPGTLLVTETFYDAQGRVTRTVDPLLRARTYEYDALDRMIAATDPLGNQARSRYDAHSNLMRRDQIDLVRDPDNNAVIGQRVFSSISAYDELDRIVSNTDSLGNLTHYLYDSRGNQVKRVDPLGNVVRTECDIFNRRVATQQELTETGLGGGLLKATAKTGNEYDRNGNLVGVVDARDRRTQYRYDALDRRRAIIYPDKSQMLFDYDRDGNLIRTEDNNGLQRRYTPDPLGRTTRVNIDKSRLATDITVEGATFEQYRYDGLDRRIFEENDFARCDIHYNSLGWPLTETTTITTLGAPLNTALVISREFNDAGAVIALTYPNGRRLRSNRDNLNRLTLIQNLTNGVNYPGSTATPDIYDIVRMEYAGHQRSRCLHGNGIITRYAHDGAGRLIEIAHTSPVRPLLTIQYLFDSVGNVRVRHDISPKRDVAETFAYDSSYRLADEAQQDGTAFDPTNFAPAAMPLPEPIPNRQAELDTLMGSLALPSGFRTFQYDLVGNREMERPTDGSQVAYGVNELDQYTTRSNLTFTYDHSGNLKRDGQREYTYDSMNRLVQVTDLSIAEIIARFVHDARGRRVLEVNSGTSTHLVWDGDDLIAEYRDSRPFALYAHDDGVDRPLQIALEGDEHWYQVDLVGSVRLLTDRTGNLSAEYRYSPFGVPHEENETSVINRLRYVARPFDAASATYNFRAREYDPSLGRFAQRDPAGMADSSNLYAYAANNPLLYADPRGTGRSERGSNDLLEQLQAEWATARHPEGYATAMARATGYSPAEIVAGEEIHMFDRGALHLQRVFEFYNTDAVSDEVLYKLDPSHPAHDYFYLRAEDLQAESFGLGNWLTGKEFRGPRKIAEIMRRHNRPITREWLQERTRAHPVMANLHFPYGENGPIAIPVTSETIWGIRLARGDPEVFRSLLGAIGWGVSALWTDDYEGRMTFARNMAAFENVVGSYATARSGAININDQIGPVGPRKPPQEEFPQAFPTRYPQPSPTNIGRSKSQLQSGVKGTFSPRAQKQQQRAEQMLRRQRQR